MTNEKLLSILNELHSEVALLLLKKLKSGKVTATDINAAINLLKHDKVYAIPEDSEINDELMTIIKNEFSETVELQEQNV